MLSRCLFAALLAALPAFAQSTSANGEGVLDGPTTSPEAAGYSCDPSTCQLPKCHCASADPPGGLNASDVPMFLVFTADDALETYTLDAVNQFLAHRKNPNGCPVKMTFYVSTNWTNFTDVTDWYVAGNEIADHTMTHVGDPPSEEINGNLMALNAFSGIPLSAIKGFRAPFLNYSTNTLKMLQQASFTYDSSASAAVPVTDPNTDAYWPYTLDHGLANDCLRIPGVCKGEPKLPGFWEVPMYASFDDGGVRGVHLMDPWLDTATGQKGANDAATLKFLQNTFTAHYNNKRQPFGLYTHPIHVALTYPGVTASKSTVDMINQFLDWAQNQQNVWIVSTEQLLAWVQNPKPISQLDQVDALKCSTPNVEASQKICNGMPQNENGLVAHCAFNDFPWYTCYGCPSQQPTPSNPVPDQDSSSGQVRYHLPANCSTPFWDPIGNKCICSASNCQFTDTSRAIGPNGANLTGGGTGAQASTSYVPFNSAVQPFDAGFAPTLLLGLIAMLVGGFGVLGRL